MTDGFTLSMILHAIKCVHGWLIYHTHRCDLPNSSFSILYSIYREITATMECTNVLGGVSYLAFLLSEF